MGMIGVAILVLFGLFIVFLADMEAIVGFLVWAFWMVVGVVFISQGGAVFGGIGLAILVIGVFAAWFALTG